MLSAQEMFDKGLLLLRPYFIVSHGIFHYGSANPVLAMYGMANVEPFQTPDLVRECIDIGHLCGRKYRMSTAMSIVTIVPGQNNADIIAQSFRETGFGSE